MCYVIFRALLCLYVYMCVGMSVCDVICRALLRMDQKNAIPQHHPLMHPMANSEKLHKLLLDDKHGFFRMPPRSQMQKKDKHRKSGEVIQPSSLSLSLL